MYVLHETRLLNTVKHIPQNCCTLLILLRRAERARSLAQVAVKSCTRTVEQL
jgi:hypothetical protein